MTRLKAKVPPAKLRLSRAEQKEQRSKDLLDAAEVKFREKGYEAVTIDDVAEYAGVSRMPVYSLFGDKQTLFFELWQRTVGDISEALRHSAPPGQPLRRKLKALAETIAASNRAVGEDDPGMQLFFVVQTIALSQPEIARKLKLISRKIVADFTEYIRQSTLAEGEVLRGNAEMIAAHLIAHINGLSTVQFQTGKHYMKARDLHEIFVSIALKGA